MDPPTAYPPERLGHHAAPLPRRAPSASEAAYSSSQAVSGASLDSAVTRGHCSRLSPPRRTTPGLCRAPVCTPGVRRASGTGARGPGAAGRDDGNRRAAPRTGAPCAGPNASCSSSDWCPGPCVPGCPRAVPGVCAALVEPVSHRKAASSGRRRAALGSTSPRLPPHSSTLACGTRRTGAARAPCSPADSCAPSSHPLARGATRPAVRSTGASTSARPPPQSAAVARGRRPALR